MGVATIDAVPIIHGHTDYSGWLPRLVKIGFKVKVIVDYKQNHTQTDDICLLGVRLT